MELGAFSISLAVKDLEASKTFYEKFGFTVFGGDPSQRWIILKNGDHIIGLFQGMFDRNMLTFNPGWDSNAQNLSAFTDVRELQVRLKAQGVQLVNEVLVFATTCPLIWSGQCGITPTRIRARQTTRFTRWTTRMTWMNSRGNATICSAWSRRRQSAVSCASWRKRLWASRTKSPHSRHCNAAGSGFAPGGTDLFVFRDEK